MNTDALSQEPINGYAQHPPDKKQKACIYYAKPYVKCLAILISNCYSSTIVDERNFDSDDTKSILEFNQKYADDNKYRCFQTVLNDQTYIQIL